MTRLQQGTITVNGLKRSHLEAQLKSAIDRRCWWAEDRIRFELRELDRLEREEETRSVG